MTIKTMPDVLLKAALEKIVELEKKLSTAIAQIPDQDKYMEFARLFVSKSPENTAAPFNGELLIGFPASLENMSDEVKAVVLSAASRACFNQAENLILGQAEHDSTVH